MMEIGGTSRPGFRSKSGLAREGTGNVRADQSTRSVTAVALVLEDAPSGLRRRLTRIPSTHVSCLDAPRLQCKRIYLGAFLGSTRASAARSGYHMSTLSLAHGPLSLPSSEAARMIGMAARTTCAGRAGFPFGARSTPAPQRSSCGARLGVTH